MKHSLAFWALIFIAAAAGAQSVWSGNAAVGLPSEFPISSAIPRAASNTFPVGTVLQVINPATGLSVDVEVTGPVRSPGVFILVDTDAALSIGLPSDLVVPVRVSPKSFGSAEELTSRLNGDNALTDDIDYNPAAVFGYAKDKPPKEEPEEPEETPPAPVIPEEPTEAPLEDPVIPEESAEDPVIPEETVEDPVTPEEPAEDPVIPEEPVETPVIIEEPAEDPVTPEEPVEVPAPEPLPDAVLVSSESFASSMPPEAPETAAAADKKRKAPAVPKFMPMAAPAPVPPPPVVEAAAPDEPPADETADETPEETEETAPPPPPPAEPKLGDRESIIAFDLAESEVEEPEIEDSTPLVFLDEEPEIEEAIARAAPAEDPEEDPAEAPETEEVPVETVPVETAPVETVPVEPVKEDPVEVVPPVDEDSERTVYFLTPSDLRPPEAPPEDAPADTAPIEPTEPTEPTEPIEDTALIPSPELTEAPPEPSAPPEPLEASSVAMERLSPSDSRPYIQIGAYRDPAVLSQAAREAASLAPGYPLSYAADTDESGAVYRLLIGPLKPAERGVVLKTARSSLFPDAFPYAQ